MKKKFVSLVSVVVIMVVCFAGCSSGSKNDRFYNASDPIQVIDSAGRKVSFSEPAKTVATSWGGGVDMYLYALGVGDRIVATNSKHGIDRMFFDPDTMEKVGRWALDKEALAEVSPDLFLHGAYASEQLEGANKVGVRAYGMGFFSFDDIQKNLTELGIVFGVEERAKYVNDYCDRIRILVESRVGQIPEEERPTVVVLGGKTGEMASDIYDSIEAMTAMAGGISCTPYDMAVKTETTVVGLETIFNWNPDFVFLQDYYCELSVDSIMNDATWKPMTAVQNKHVYEIPSEIDAWSKGNPSCYLGTLYMSMMMYPELYEDADIKKIAVDFYYEVYGLDLTLAEIGIK